MGRYSVAYLDRGDLRLFFGLRKCKLFELKTLGVDHLSALRFESVEFSLVYDLERLLLVYLCGLGQGGAVGIHFN